MGVVNHALTSGTGAPCPFLPRFLLPDNTRQCFDERAACTLFVLAAHALILTLKVSVLGLR
jgi:hypothetical protein